MNLENIRKDYEEVRARGSRANRDPSQYYNLDLKLQPCFPVVSPTGELTTNLIGKVNIRAAGNSLVKDGAEKVGIGFSKETRSPTLVAIVKGTNGLRVRIPIENVEEIENVLFGYYKGNRTFDLVEK